MTRGDGRCLEEEREELMDRDPVVRDLVDRMMPAVLLAEEALRILGEAEAARGETRTSDRTSDLGTPMGSTLRVHSSVATGPPRSC